MAARHTYTWGELKAVVESHGVTDDFLVANCFLSAVDDPETWVEPTITTWERDDQGYVEIWQFAP
jgi:hypothetical protein